MKVQAEQEETRQAILKQRLKELINQRLQESLKDKENQKEQAREVKKMEKSSGITDQMTGDQFLELHKRKTEAKEA